MKGQLTRQFPFSFWNCQHSSTFFWLIPTLHYTCSILCFWERGTFIKEDGYTALIKHRGHASRETQTGRQKATGARAVTVGSVFREPFGFYVLCAASSADQHSLFSTHMAKCGCSSSTEYRASLLYFLSNLISLKVIDSLTLHIRIPVPRPNLFDLGAKLTCDPIRSFRIKFHLTWSSAII